MKRERKQFRRIVFLDPQAAFGLPELPWWSCHSRRDEYELATELDKRPRDWTREEYYYVPLIEKVPGYRQVFDAAANRWDAAAVKGFAEILEKHDAGFVLSSEVRETLGRRAIASLFALHDLDLRFVDMTVTPAPLFLDGMARKLIEGAADRSLLELYTRTMKSLWDGLSGDGTGVRRIDHRAVEIIEYLDRHPEIESFAVVDDRDLSIGLGADRMVVCDGVLDEVRLRKLDAALQKQQGVPRLPASCRTDELQCFRAECVPALYRRWRDPEFCGISRH